jgi:hypothetical protein
MHPTPAEHAHRLATARSVLASLAPPRLPSASPSIPAAPPALPSPSPSAADPLYALRLSAFTQAGRCARLTTPFAPSAPLLHLHAARAAGASVALLGALGGCGAGGAAAARFPARTAPDSLALRDGVAGGPGAVDAAAAAQQLLFPLGLQGWRGAEPSQQQPLAPAGYSAAASSAAGASAAYEAAGQRAAAAAADGSGFAWPTGAEHALQALRLSVLPPAPRPPPARAGFSPQSLALLGSLHAWQCEGKLMEQRRSATTLARGEGSAAA